MEAITENVIVAVLAVSPGMLTVVAGVLRVVVAMLIVALAVMGGLTLGFYRVTSNILYSYELKNFQILPKVALEWNVPFRGHLRLHSWSVRKIFFFCS